MKRQKVVICIYTGCPPKSGTLVFRYFDIRKDSIFWFHQTKHCILKRMIPRLFDFVRKYWFYNHFLKHSHLRILLNLPELLMAGIAVHKFSLCFVCTDQWASGQQCMDIRKATIPAWKCHENEAKVDNDYILRNDHRIKTAQPISMILVSFVSEDNVLSNEIKTYYIVEYQSNENRAFAFLGHPMFVFNS